MSGRIRTVIVDDEQPARRAVEHLLKGDAEVEICGLCADGSTALNTLEREKPDLLFLDIQMPGIDGFEVLRQHAERSNVETLPTVIFVTAFDRYAVQAFEVHALDYLLKPYSDSRFFHALDRAKREILLREAAGSKERVAEMVRERAMHEARTPPIDRLAVKTDGGTVFVGTGDIIWLEAADHYVILHLANRSHIIRVSMKHLESRLDANRFLRVHRSAIVNVDYLKGLRSTQGDESELILETGKVLRASRRRLKALKARLGL